MPNTFIVVHDSPDGTTYPTDTQEEIALAIDALRASGEESARVYVGDPECPDSYWNGRTLYVPACLEVLAAKVRAALRGEEGAP